MMRFLSVVALMAVVLSACSATANPDEVGEPQVPEEADGDASVVHIDEISGSALNEGNMWRAEVTVIVVDGTGTPVSDISVSGTWDEGDEDESSCETDSDGECQMTSGSIRKNVEYTTLSIVDVVHLDLNYDSAEDHDPDTLSKGTTIRVRKS